MKYLRYTIKLLSENLGINSLNDNFAILHKMEEEIYTYGALLKLDEYIQEMDKWLQ